MPETILNVTLNNFSYCFIAKHPDNNLQMAKSKRFILKLTL